MKINWFSPLPPEKTDIGNFTARILSHLIQHADVTVWTEQNKWNKSIDHLCKINHVSEINWIDLNNGITIYNIGNNPYYHARTWEISTEHPGIVILHDYHLQHLFGGIFKEQKYDENYYYNIMQRYYGMNGKLAAKDFWHGKLSTEYMSEHFPLADFVLENALGVIVHSHYAFEKIAQKNRWPVALIPLPYPSSIDHIKIAAHIKNRLTTINSKCNIILFGYLGPNRRVESVLQAFAVLRDRNRYSLDIYGQLWDKRLLENKVKELNLQNHVKIHGFVSEERLDGALAQAHIAINLRFPTMGEASGTQLRIWNHALPSLVTKTGWYAELPLDTVWFVRPEREVEDIALALSKIIQDPARFFKMGEKGKQYLKQNHNPDLYTQSIIRFAHEVCSGASRVLAHKLIERVTSEMRIWNVINEKDIVCKHTATAIYDLISH